MKRVISICLALWLSVSCCYALETHSKQVEPLPESSETILGIPTTVPEQPQEIDYSELLNEINSKLTELITYMNFLCFMVIPIVFAVGLVFLIVGVLKIFIEF